MWSYRHPVCCYCLSKTRYRRPSTPPQTGAWRARGPMPLQRNKGEEDTHTERVKHMEQGHPRPYLAVRTFDTTNAGWCSRYLTSVPIVSASCRTSRCRMETVRLHQRRSAQRHLSNTHQTQQPFVGARHKLMTQSHVPRTEDNASLSEHWVLKLYQHLPRGFLLLQRVQASTQKGLYAIAEATQTEVPLRFARRGICCMHTQRVSTGQSVSRS